MDISKLLQIIPLLVCLAVYGSAVLKVFHIHALKGVAHFTVSFWIGSAVLSVLLLLLAWTGHFSESAIWVLLVAALPTLLWRRNKRRGFFHVDKEHFFSILFILIALITLPSAMIPVTENATLATHFSVAKSVAVQESLVFSNIATLSAAPMYFHILGAAAYKIGESNLLQLTFWLFNIMGGLAVFTLARRRLRVGASWIVATLIASTPVMIYSAGTGIIEPRLLGPVAIATLFLTLYARSEQKTWLSLTALMVGFMLGAHVIGAYLAFAFLFGVLLAAKDFGWKKCCTHLAMFSGIVIAIGGLMHLVRYVYTGTMSRIPANWPAEQTDAFNTYVVDALQFTDRSFGNWLWGYALEMTQNATQWGVSHMGLGPILLLSFIPAIFILLRRFPFFSWEKQIGTLEMMIAIFVVFYTLWFIFDASMEPKNILPALPLILIPAYILGQSLRAHASFLARSILMGTVFVLVALQMGMAIGANKTEIAVFFRYIDDEKYKNTVLPASVLATYMNSTAGAEATVLHTNLSALNYHLNRPVVYAPPVQQSEIPFLTGAPVDVLNKVLELGITHWATDSDVMLPSNDSIFNGNKVLRELMSYGCFNQDIALTASTMQSSHLFYIYEYVENCAGNTK